MRTFGGLAIFLTLGLLCLGFYLIEDQFANPLASQSLGLFAAAFILATAMTLLYELIQLPRNIWRNAVECPTLLVPPAEGMISVAARRASGFRCDQRTDLPYQRSYVDRVRVRA
jgi:hypothetical protein